MKWKIAVLSLLSFLLFGLFSFAALDLKFISAISISPASPKIGDTVTFSVTFKAEGGAASDVKVIGHVDGTLIYNRVYGSIPANATRTDSFTWTATAGSHNVSFTLDPSHTAGDSDYTNNTVSKTFSVSDTGGGLKAQDALAQKKVNIKPLAKVKPDLVSQIHVFPSENGNFSCNQTWGLTLIIKNNGKIGAKKTFTNKVHTDLTHDVFTCDITGLETWDEAQCHWTFQFDPEIGHMWFQAEVDINNTIDESIETNNIYEISEYCNK